MVITLDLVWVVVVGMLALKTAVAIGTPDDGFAV
jgi:hypothetical protein